MPNFPIWVGCHEVKAAWYVHDGSSLRHSGGSQYLQMKSQADCEALRRNVDGVTARDAHVHQMGAPEYLNILLGIGVINRYQPV